MADSDAERSTTEERTAVPAWRFPGPDRDALLDQRAGLIDEVRALEALIAAKRRQIRALEKLAGAVRPFGGRGGS